MKSIIITGLLWGMGGLTLSAQSHDLARRGLPFIKKIDQLKMKTQSDDFYSAIQPLSQKLGVHAVNVLSSGRIIGRGTVTESGIVAKWSELGSRRYDLAVVGHYGVQREASVKAVYLEYDLVLLECDEGLPAVDFASKVIPEVGKFILAVGPAKDSHGFGVVSVEPRSLRDQDKAYLGVRMGSVIDGHGVLIEWAQPNSAADKAGITRGDVVTQIDQMQVGGLYEMRSYLQKLSPGDLAVLKIKRGEEKFSVDVQLGATPKRQKSTSRRMQYMKSMGGSLNEVAEGFPDVLQSDMQVDSVDSGSPVFDLDGKFVGVIVARASRIKTYIITADKLADQLKKKPDMEAAPKVKVKSPTRAERLAAKKREEILQLREIINRAQRRLSELER
mgnify:CR=1 FL=1